MGEVTGREEGTDARERVGRAGGELVLDQIDDDRVEAPAGPIIEIPRDIAFVELSDE